MSTYASKTTVAPEKSRAEIEKTLKRYGAAAFSYGYDDERAVVMFAAAGRKLRFELATPRPEDFRYDAAGRRRQTTQVMTARDQAERQIWRALALVIKAKLEAVQSGIVSFEEEFLAHILLPSGETVGQWTQPQLQDVYETGLMPSVLPGARLALSAGDD